MKEIRIKTLHLVNFKGVQELTVDFGKTTQISGRNGSGKTTVFDAFCYALFGKDSLGRTNFGIKTVGADGEPLWKLPHEVECTLEVGSETVTILRGWKEKWVKKHGETESKFCGHDEVRMFNGVPMSAAEMKETIAEICNEETFRLVTSLTYFPMLKPDAQRAILLSIIGDVSNEDVADGNENFQRLLSQLSGKSLENFKREIAAKKSRLKKALDDIPPRIEENERNKKAVEPWREELATAEANLADVEKQLQDVAARATAENEKKLSAVNELQKAKENLSATRFNAQEAALAGYRKELADYNEKESEYNILKNEVSNITASISRLDKELAELSAQREMLLHEWRGIKSRELVINPDVFVCPTCGRQLEMDAIEAKALEMKGNFNAQKVQALEENKRKGLQVRDNTTKKDEVKKALQELLNEKQSALAQFESLAKPVMPDTDQTIANNEEVKKAEEDVKRLEEALKNMSVKLQDGNQMLVLRKNELTVYVDTLKARRATEKANEELSARISELNNEMRTLSQELADLERSEMECEKFSHARSEIIEKRVNDMFSLVKFRLFEKQINGGLNETCIITVNGVPYRDLNNAMRIHAGCDILNVIAKKKEIIAPVWIDNVETLNEVPHIDAQLTLLRVTEDDYLKIKTI